MGRFLPVDLQDILAKWLYWSQQTRGALRYSGFLGITSCGISRFYCTLLVIEVWGPSKGDHTVVAYSVERFILQLHWHH